MNSRLSATGREGHSDAALLCAIAGQDGQAALELYRRHAPRLYAFAHRARVADPERAVQEAWLLITRHAHCQARASLEAHVWIIAMAQRSFAEGHSP